MKVKDLICLLFETGEAPIQTGSGPEIGQPQNAVLALLCQRGSRWREAAVDYTFIFQISNSEEGQSHFDLFGL